MDEFRLEVVYTGVNVFSGPNELVGWSGTVLAPTTSGLAPYGQFFDVETTVLAQCLTTVAGTGLSITRKVGAGTAYPGSNGELYSTSNQVDFIQRAISSPSGVLDVYRLEALSGLDCTMRCGCVNLTPDEYPDTLYFSMDGSNIEASGYSCCYDSDEISFPLTKWRGWGNHGLFPGVSIRHINTTNQQYCPSYAGSGIFEGVGNVRSDKWITFCRLQWVNYKYPLENNGFGAPFTIENKQPGWEIATLTILESGYYNFIFHMPDTAWPQTSPNYFASRVVDNNAITSCNPLSITFPDVKQLCFSTGVTANRCCCSPRPVPVQFYITE